MSIKVIPDELLHKIFDQLNVGDRILLKTVNKKWNELCLRSVKRVSFFGINRNEMNEFFFDLKKESTAVKVSSWRQVERLLQKCGKIDCVEFFDCQFKDIQHLNEVAEQIASVTTLRFYFFTRASSDDNNLLLLISKTSLIKQFTLIFDITFFSGWDSRINVVVDEVLTKNNGIQSLQLRSSDLKFNCTLLPPLKEFNVRIPESLYKLPESGMSQLLLKSKNTLQMLRYPISMKEDFELMTQFTKLTDLRLLIMRMNTDGFRRFKFQNLVQLQLNIYTGVDIASVISGIGRNQRLKAVYLRLEICLQQSVDMSIISDNCKELEFVALYPFDSFKSCLELLSNLPKLEYLELAGCRTLTDQRMAMFVSQAQSLRGVAVYHSSGELNDTLQSMKAKANSNESKYFFARLPISRHLLRGYPKNLKVKVESSDPRTYDGRQWNHFFLVDHNAVYNDDFLAWKLNAQHFLN